MNWRESAAAVDMPARHTEAVCVSAGHDFSAVVSCAGSVFTFGGGSYVNTGYGVCLENYHSILSLPYSLSSGVLGSPDLLQH